MAVKLRSRKDPAAVALGRKGGKKGGLARAAKLTAEERSKIARKAVQARWDKAKERKDSTERHTKSNAGSGVTKVKAVAADDTSDRAVLSLLRRLKTTDDPAEIRKLSDELERAIFHKQYPAA